MKIYTKTGDKGETGLLGGIRISKTSDIIHAIGEIDELNASLGILITLSKECEHTEHTDRLLHVQHTLFVLGATLAQVKTDIPFATPLSEKEVFALEEWIDEMDGVLSPLTQFILPGGNTLASEAFYIRAVCRRAERAVIKTVSSENEHTFSSSIMYLNRLSDTLFTLGRWYNANDRTPETYWVK